MLAKALGVEGGGDSIIGGSVDGACDGRSKVKRLRVDANVFEHAVSEAFANLGIDGFGVPSESGVGVSCHGCGDTILEM